MKKKYKYKYLLILSGVGIESRLDKHTDAIDTSDVSCLNGEVLDLWSIGAQKNNYIIDLYDESHGEIDPNQIDPLATFTSRDIATVRSADNFDLDHTPRYGFVNVSKGTIGHLAFETASKFDIGSLQAYATEFEKNEFVVDRFKYTGWQEESIGAVLPNSNNDFMAIDNTHYMDLREISNYRILEV